MISKSLKSDELYAELLYRGYPQPFCQQVAQSLNTDFTAGRMLGYLKYIQHPPMETIADEMLAILAERDRYRQKKIQEWTNTRLNELLWNGVESEEQ